MASGIKTPWHVWVVGALTLLWNAFGAFDYVMTRTKNEAYLSAFTEEQLNYFFNMPLVYSFSWGLAIWTSVAGSILLLLRMKLATLMFLVSIIGFVIGAIYSIFLYVMPGIELGHHLFSLVIFIILVLSWWYAHAMTRKGILR